MGCISSKSFNHQQPNIPNHHLISILSPSNTNHTINDALDSIPPKHDSMLTVDTNTNHKTDDTLERCASFHTVEEYDELLQRINNNDAELVGAPVSVLTPDNTDSACKKDSDVEKGIKRNTTVDIGNMEFQTVASLRQWLHSASGGGDGEDADSATDNNNNNNKTRGENSVLVEIGKQQEEESIVELVAAFDLYMQQLQIDEDNILKQIHNMID